MNSAQPHHLSRAWKAAESHCIKCGFCLPVCPTYQETGQESASPRGRLDLMAAAAHGMLPMKSIEPELSKCLGCLACETACPSAIRYRDQLEAAVLDLHGAGSGFSKGMGDLIGRIISSPGKLRLAVWLLWLFQRSGVHALLKSSRLLDLLLPKLGGLLRVMPPLRAPVDWRGRALGLTAGQDSVNPPLLLPGCVMDAQFGAVHLATLKVLHHNGKPAKILENAGCCGALQYHSGDLPAARAHAMRHIEMIEAAGEGPVLINAAGCGAHLKALGNLFEEEPELKRRAEYVSARVLDICEYLATVVLVPPANPLQLRVAYDDPCHLAHAQGIREQPRNLLGMIPGLTLLPLPESEWCCGSAGSYSLKQPEMSLRILNRKINHLRQIKPDVLTSGNPGCLLHLRLGAGRELRKMEVLHPVELLARSYE